MRRIARRTDVLIVCFCVGLCLVSPDRANSDEPPERPGRFRLWHDLGDMLSMTWGGTRAAFTLSSLTYAVPAAGLIGGASFADDEVQAVFAGNDEDDPGARWHGRML